MRNPGRFIPVRVGIVNLYEYDDQVLEFADGRLLLRGHNTSGKTKALELLLPFCLDGDINPRKLDPFAKTAKEMKWNLIGCVESEQRIGYVWLEFARLTANGLDHVTAGIGMKATSGRDGVQRWYFLLRGRRVGHDLALRRADYPLTRRELAEQLGDADELLTSPSEYRRRLNDVVYGFPSIEQYETMVSLLLELRRPHLSKALNARDVAALLSASLPEIDHDLMRRLGEGLEQLDDLQAALSTLEAVRARVEQFNRSAYRAYAQAAIAERGERLRRAETAHGNASVARRELVGRLERASAEARAATQALAHARAGLDAAEGAREALLQSAEWASVAEVEQLGRAAGQARVAAQRARDRAGDASARVAVDEADAITARTIGEESEAAFTRVLTALATDAAHAGFSDRHAGLAPALEDSDREPATIAELLREECERLLLVLGEHQQQLDALAKSQRDHEHARTAQADAEAQVRLAGDRRAELQAQADQAGEALSCAVETWAGELVELHLDAAVLARTIELALQAGGEGAHGASEAWQAAVDEHRGGLLGQFAVLGVRRGQLAAEREALVAQRGALAAERDESPPSAYTRPGPRAERLGAPLWVLVDFASGVTQSDRAGIEAALEGAGLLDAWVAPHGVLSNPNTLDVVLDARTGRAGEHTLTDVLVAAREGPVEQSVVRAVLEAIALVPDAADGPYDRPAALIDRDGRFRLGPARGRFAKAQAEYIGAAARAQRRARRIAELDRTLAEIDARDGELAAERAALERRLATLAVEIERFPSTAALASARRGLAVAEQREREARAELAERERGAASAAHRRTHAQSVLSGHAESCGLPGDLDHQALRTRETAAHRYVAGIAGVVQAAERRRQAIVSLDDLERRLHGARAAAVELAGTAELADADARRLEAEHGEREAALGSTGEEIRARMHVAQARVGELRGEIARLEQADKAMAVEAKRLEGELVRAEGALGDAAREREAALAAFRRLELGDAFVLGLEQDAPADHGAAADWTLTRALEALRAIPTGRISVRSSLVSLANKVQQQCTELDRALGQQADMGVVAESDADGFVIVRVRQGAGTLSVAQLMRGLDDEIAERERTLSAEQRRIFNDTLLEEIAEHLRGRIERVAGLVADMNATLAHCPTGSGKTVQLEWSPREDGGPELRAVTRLLRRSVSTLGEQERGPLILFFRERIQHAREQSALGTGAGDARDPAAGAGPGQGATAHLRTAFDYRQWFEFTLHEVTEGQRVKLTPKRHALGSGGEQAVLIHMPLFAAAAALYASSRDGRAPRLVILDEALSGIDDATREKVLGVLVALDLDVVMTSHELWGTYRSVPALSIYQLHRENGAFGVASEHFLWDGESLRELEQASQLE